MNIVTSNGKLHWIDI